MGAEFNKSNVFIVIPAWNESKHIRVVLEKVKSFGYSNIVVVDDGSVDNTSDISYAVYGVKVLRHIVNLGKGCALKTGCDYAHSRGADVIVVMDSDGQHRPEDIGRFLKSLEMVDIVFGYRKLSGKMPFVLRFGNWFINTVSSVLFGILLKDTQSGFRAFRAKIYPKIRWGATDYFMESEMIANVGKNGFKFKEIPIETIYIDGHKGTTVFHGIEIVLNMFKLKFLR